MKHLRLSADALARTLSVAVLAVMVLAIGIGTTSNARKPEHKDESTKTFISAAQMPPVVSQTKVKKFVVAQQPARASRAHRASRTAAPKSMALRQVWLKGVLYEAGFRGKGLRTAWAVAMRESHGNPKSHNKNRRTGDNSYGLFQINMIGNLGYERRAKFDLESNSQLLNPLNNARIAYRMTKHGKDWSSWGIGRHAYNGNRNEPAYRKWLKHYPKSN